MIALEWDVGCLRQRGVRFADLTGEERLLVATHYYKRRLAPTFDATTGEAATPLDLIHIQRTLTTKPKAAEPADMSKTLGRLAELRDAAVAREVARGD